MDSFPCQSIKLNTFSSTYRKERSIIAIIPIYLHGDSRLDSSRCWCQNSDNYKITSMLLIRSNFIENQINIQIKLNWSLWKKFDWSLKLFIHYIYWLYSKNSIRHIQFIQSNSTTLLIAQLKWFSHRESLFFYVEK